MRWRDRLYRALLHSYPAEFRDDYGAEMTQLFRDRLRAEPEARVWFDLLTDTAMTAPREHASILFNDLRYALRMLRKARHPACSPGAATRIRVGEDLIAANVHFGDLSSDTPIRSFPTCRAEACGSDGA